MDTECQQVPDVSAVVESAKTDHLMQMTGDSEAVTHFSTPNTNLFSRTYQLEHQITYLKHSLRDVREVVLMAKTVLTWQKQWHPTAIIGSSTVLFMFLWLSEPSLLTTVSIMGLIFTLSDYLLPSIVSAFIGQTAWTVDQEREFSDVCRNIVLYRTKFITQMSSFYLLRSTRPKIYYGTNIFALLLLAWIGNVFNNLFLTYLVVTALLLLPGLEKQGTLKKYGNAVYQKWNDFVTNAKQTVVKNKNE